VLPVPISVPSTYVVKAMMLVVKQAVDSLGGNAKKGEFEV
jgi:hypothetical protein